MCNKGEKVFFRDPRINVGKYFHDMQKCMEKLKMLQNYAKRLLEFYDYYLKHNGGYLFPDRMRTTKIIVKILKNICESENLESVIKLFSELGSALSSMANYHALIIIRHPDKSVEGNKSWSVKGPLQAKWFSEMLILELLAAPDQVGFELNVTNLRRTQLVAEIFARKLKSAIRDYGKDSPIYAGMEEDLFIDKEFQKPAAPGTPKRKLRETTEDMLDWCHHPQNWPLCDSPKDTFDRFYHFIKKSISDLDLTRHSKIIVAVTHAPTIFPYIYQTTGISDYIEAAEIIKFEKNRMLYKGKWYNAKV